MTQATTPRQQFEAQVATLIAKFNQHRTHYLSTAYNETDVRAEFIDPLFEALGWDVANRAGRGPHDKEVIREKSDVNGRYDYLFQLNGRAMFIVEAKAPHVPLESTNVIMQAKTYAWNAKETSIAAITDFEEFRLYDATVKPDPKHPEVGLIFAARYTDYLKPKTADELWLLSKEAVAAGSIEQLLKMSSVKQRERLPVDVAFLDDLTTWREKLAKAVFKIEPEIDPADLNSVVQVFLDRLIFIRFAEDHGILTKRGLEDVARLWERSGKHRSIVNDLNALFHEVNDLLNGEIFKPHRCEKIDWDQEAALVAKIIQALYDGPYRFDVIGVELLGSIYERYLGKTIRVTATRAVVEDKPEVRKAGGVYYTPRYIVDYIVAQTVGRLIEGKTPAQIAKLKILDPACGSGSFLLGAYQTLIEYHERYYSGKEKGKQIDREGQLSLIDAGEGGEYRLPLAEKAAILKNNLCGVDIDPQAVEITMMSLYIKLLEGERGAIMDRRVLPPLRDNIKCGNSLIGYDIREQPGITAEDVERIKPFDWHSQREGFGDIMQAGGFDAVIGNPPYGAMFGGVEASYFQRKYQVFRGARDVYTCFMEMGLNQMKSGGRFSFIVPSAWLGGPEYIRLRQLVLGQQIETVILLPFDVFPDAYVDTAIVVFSKRKYEPSHQIKTHIYGKRERINIIDLAEDRYQVIAQKEWFDSEGNKFVLDLGTVKILEQLRKRVAMTFAEVVQIKRGVLFDKHLLSGKRTGANSHPYFEGDVYRYELNLVADRWIEFGDEMKERPKEFAWFEGSRLLLRRLVNRKQRLMATFAQDTFITNKNLYSVLPASNRIDLRAVLGVLNSRLISYLYINQVTQATKDDFPQVTIKDVLALPFPAIDHARHDRMVTLVQRMLDLHQQQQAAGSEAARERLQREINVTDEQIDKLVYELYGLTAEEIKIVEGK
jgi:adenine-specific DNA-methyltransferase